MGVLEIITVLIVLLITFPFISKMWKKCAPCSAKETCANEAKTQEEVEQQAELQTDEQAPADDSSEPATETQAPEPAVVSALEPQPSEKPQTVALPENDSHFPQDSILKRHYLSHLSAMVETLAPPRPSDAVLCRHYDTMVLAKIDHCLNDKQAMEQLVDDYQNNKPIGNVEAGETAVLPENEDDSSALPQDSILKRHYLNHLCAMIEALAPQRPSDAVLCRHYDAMITAKIDQCLNDKKAMAQLVYDYENRLSV